MPHIKHPSHNILHHRHMTHSHHTVPSSALNTQFASSQSKIYIFKLTQQHPPSYSPTQTMYVCIYVCMHVCKYECTYVMDHSPPQSNPSPKYVYHLHPYIPTPIPNPKSKSPREHRKKKEKKKKKPYISLRRAISHKASHLPEKHQI